MLLWTAGSHPGGPEGQTLRTRGQGAEGHTQGEGPDSEAGWARPADLLPAPHRRSRAALFRPSGRQPGPQPLSAGSWKKRLRETPGTLSGKSPQGPRPTTVLPAAASVQQTLAALGCVSSKHLFYPSVPSFEIQPEFHFVSSLYPTSHDAHEGEASAKKKISSRHKQNQSV